MFGIDFVKIASVEAARKYEVTNIPSLVYFRLVYKRLKLQSQSAI